MQTAIRETKNMSTATGGLTHRRIRGGQTIIVAMIIMGLLLIIGFVFIGIINRNIKTAGRMQSRSVAFDLSEAGIRYALAQLLQSELGADWRGTPSAVAPAGVDVTTDPDVLYLRPGTGLPFRAGSSRIDLGGPDGLGPFIRTNFNNGRSLFRVRYAPSDINIFSPSPSGAMRNPGMVRNYLIIESVGRAGRINPTDPTTLSSSNAIQFQNYSDANQFHAALAQMEANEASFGNRAINRAFASIGIIESARYVTNKHNVTRPVELGVSSMLGAMYRGRDVATGDGTVAPLALELGTFLPLYTISNNPSLTAQAFPGFGSMYVNGDVVLHGNVVANLNRALGDKIVVSGGVTGADGNARLTVRSTDLTGGVWTSSNVALGSIDSRDPAFLTGGGLLVDGMARLDPQGYPRGAGRKVPPSAFSVDQESGENRYVLLTKETGVQAGGINNGVYGHGSGVYVNNSYDRQTPEDEAGRQAAGSDSSLVYDWLNPNNGQTKSGWRGFLYAPDAAYVQLVSDGFVITRNSAGPADERTWRRPDGSDSGSAAVRYRIGYGTDGRLRIVNTYTPSVVINGNLGPGDFDRGPVFNGVLYFEGNVRIRGIIPTDLQLTLVSAANVYIEGSITKGVLGNGLQTGVPYGERIQRLSHSMLMLIAKDYVTLNTTQFFGTQPTQAIEPVADVANAPGYTPIRVRTGEQLAMQSEFALNNEFDTNIPSINPLNPSTWRPYAAQYYPFNTPGSRITTSLLLAQAMDDGPAPATFATLNVNFGAFDTASPPESTYYFSNSPTNLVSSIYPTYAGEAVPPIYGLGGETFQRFGKFESSVFPLVDPSTVNVTDARLMIANSVGTFNGQAYTNVYRLFSEGLNDFLFRQTNYGGVATNDYLVGKAAIVPHDIRIEASIFAEEGSFFVIPGQWMNPDPNDTRQAYDLTPGTTAEKDQKRLESFGSHPGTPFYGEAPDVRITIVGAVSENMPPTMDQQSEWMRKWGWIPRELGATGVEIPDQHVPKDAAYRGPSASWDWVPNLTVTYDPVLATARRAGFNNDPNTNPIIRTDEYGRALPPLPRLPVSPALAYFGEVR